MLTDAQRAMLEPLIGACRPEARPTSVSAAPDLGYPIAASEQREVALFPLSLAPARGRLLVRSRRMRPHPICRLDRV
jgi:hypothetical protein